MAYATIADLASLLGQTFDTTEATNRAQLLLDLASGEIDDAAGQPLSEVVGDAVTLDGSGTQLLMLPAWPVTAITSVTADGTALVDGDDYEWSAAGLLWRRGKRWPAKPRSVEVVYTHGYSAVPDVIRSVALNIAAARWTNPGKVSSEQLGDYSYRVSSTPDGQVQAELERVRKFAARVR